MDGFKILLAMIGLLALLGAGGIEIMNRRYHRI